MDEHVIDALNHHFGKKMEELSHEQIVTLALAYSEEEITNERLQQILDMPRADITDMLSKMCIHHIQVFFASQYVRWWFCTILFCVWLTSVFLTCIIANDNAKMHKVQEKYVLLREFARSNRDWADKADYIEFLYSDEEEHQKDIDILWEMRRKRLGLH